MSEPRAVRLALAAATGCVAAVAAYAVMRLVQKLFGSPEPDPALVIWSEHAGYFWRALTAAYLGGMSGFVAWLAAGRDAARVARLLSRALLGAAILAIAQALLVP